jgi:xanthine/CO dehydrogenase XdhC/CoxF family maturation factor
MAPRRILLIHEEGPCRVALARVLASEGHQVQVADAAEERARLNDFGPDTVVYKEGHSRIAEEEGKARLVAIDRPVNMEELRRVLREV